MICFYTEPSCVELGDKIAISQSSYHCYESVGNSIKWRSGLEVRFPRNWSGLSLGVLRVEVLSSGVISGVFEEPWVKSRGAILTTLQDNQRTNLSVPTGAVFLIWQIHVLWLICHECCIEWKVNSPGSMAIRKFPVESPLCLPVAGWWDRRGRFKLKDWFWA